MADPLIEALRTNNHINLMLFDAIDKEGMACTLSKRGGRDVLRQFAHIHDVRRMQIESRGKEGQARSMSKGRSATWRTSWHTTRTTAAASCSRSRSAAIPCRRTCATASGGEWSRS